MAEVIVPETQEKPSDVTVELDDKNQPIKAVEKKEEKYITPEQVASIVADQIKKATAPLYYEMRKTREVPVQAQPVQPVQPKPEPTEWDSKLQKDWKGTVEELADARVDAILKRREEAQRFEMERQRNFQLLEDNKKKVMERHKELNDETSQKAQTYMQVLQEHPEYLNNSFGPVLAMRDMEERLRDSGYIDDSTKHVVEKEVARQVRTNGATVPKGVSSGGKNSVTLSKEQKEFCDTNSIKYENYARFMKQSQSGVEA